jgi:hypothetical protein
MHLSLKGSMDRQPLTDRLGDRLLAEYGGATAAYSLRALNGNGDSVVRVRRASDNDEKDFTAEQIELGEMVNWVNSQTVPPLDIGVETSEGRIPVPEGGTSIGIPAAAYSLRNLSTTYTGNVVDVRRSIDDAEDSFTAAEVADGTLTDWVLAPVSSFIGNTMWFDGVNDEVVFGSRITLSGDFLFTFKVIIPISGLRGIMTETDSDPSVRVNAGVSQVIFRIDGVSNLFSFDGVDRVGELLSIELSRTSGVISAKLNGATSADTVASTTAFTIDKFGNIFGAFPSGLIFDVDFGNGTTWDGSITDAVANGWTVNGSPELFTGQGYDGFVTKWYDQSGNDNHATQGTDASQPKIVEGGTLVTGGLDFDGVNDFLTNSANIFAQTFSVFTVQTSDTDETVGISFSREYFTPNQRITISSDTRTVTKRLANYAPDATDRFINRVSKQSANTEEFITLISDGSNMAAWLDGVSVGAVTSTATPSSPNHGFRIGKQDTGPIYHSGPIQELIIYPSDQSDNRTAIEANIGETYGITGIPAYDNTVDGFVETWYDQSGNGNDATQSVAASQPKIVDGGVLVSGGLDFDGVDDLLVGTHNVTSAYNFFSVTTDEGSATSYIADTGSSASNGVNYGRTLNSGGNRQLTLNHGGFTAVNATGFLVGTELISQSYDGTTINAFVDGSLVGTSVQGYIASGTVLSLGASGSAGAFLNGKMAEIILYNSDQSANRVAIETNINAHYDIYP